MPSKSARISKPVRMRDIAQALGVSTVRVSKVFRGPRDIGPDTRQRVKVRIYAA